MSSVKKIDPIEVVIGDGSVSLKRPGQSTVVLAKVLGSKLDTEGTPQILWLDRIVHLDSDEFVGWRASGAISTVLTKERVTAKA